MKNRFAFILLLFVAFLDYLGIGLVIPLFAALLFDVNVPLLNPETSNAVRGAWMAALIALGPFVQFFASPVLGSLSDGHGRKKMILFGLGVGAASYLIGMVGIGISSIWLLILYRGLFGASAATMPVIQAAIADMSTKEGKPRNFALYNMALGTGFTLGPFLGGTLSDSSLVSWFSPSIPFLVALLCTLLNLILIWKVFKETRVVKEKSKFEILEGFKHIKAAFVHPTLKISFLGFFLFYFGWEYFAEFVSVTLIQIYNFTLGQVGNFYAYMGFLYAIFTGIVIKPFVKRYDHKHLLLLASLASGPYLLFFLQIKNPIFFWPYFVPLILLLAFFYPNASTYISESASDDEQGEIFGVYHSVQALALMLSPMLAGSLVGRNPTLPVYLGGALMIAGGLVFAAGLFLQRQKAHRLDEGS